MKVLYLVFQVQFNSVEDSTEQLLIYTQKYMQVYESTGAQQERHVDYANHDSDG